MVVCCKHHALRIIAAIMRKDEVVAQILRISSPRYEMIDVPGANAQLLRAGEAPALLQVHQHGSKRGNIAALRAEQELA
jgi:hypothetical protein